MNVPEWLDRRRIRGFRGRRLRDSLLAVLDDRTAPDERAAALGLVTADPEGLDELGVLLKIRREEGALLKDIDGLTFTPEVNRRLRAEAARVFTGARTRRSFFRPAPGRAWSAAVFAAIAITGIAALVMIVRRPEPIEAVREGLPGAFEALSPRGKVASGALEFRWTPVRGAKRYRLEIFDRELAAISRRDGVISERHRLSAEERQALEPGRSYFWKVTAELEGGDLLSSEFAKFTVAGIPVPAGPAADGEARDDPPRR